MQCLTSDRPLWNHSGPLNLQQNPGFAREFWPSGCNEKRLLKKYLIYIYF